MAAQRENSDQIATSIAQSATPALCDAMRGVAKDPIFANMPLNSITADQLILSVAISGSQLERAALARHLNPAAAFAFPDMYRMANANSKSMATSLDFLEKSILSLATFVGAAFVGDIKGISFAILKDYGGLTLADFLIFFEMAKAGKYRKEFQHVATRGVNWEYLKSWLDSYLDDKEAARLELNAQRGQPASNATEADAEKVKSAINAAKIKAFEIAEYHRRLEMDAQVFRDKWEAETHQSTIIRQWYKTIYIPADNPDVSPTYSDMIRPTYQRKEIEVACTDEDPERQRYEAYPVRVFRPGGVEKIIKRLIYESVAFMDAAKTNAIFDELKTDISKRYEKEAGGPHVFEMECKAILQRVSSFHRLYPASEIAKEHILQAHPDAPLSQVRRSVEAVIGKTSEMYYSEYLPECIKLEYPALHKSDFARNLALCSFVEAGNENPVLKILFP